VAVAVVTDSAADLPAELAREAGITVVPLVVTFGDRSFADGRDLGPEEFWRLGASTYPTTASPSPAAFAAEYAALVERGREGAVSVHLSSELSSVLHNARAAASEAALPVRVLDSRSVGVGLALVVLEAARVARSGATAEEVAAGAEDAAHRVELYAALDTVEFLRRGGRVGTARALLSDLLRIRPVLTLRDGVPTLVAKARTSSRAMEEAVARAAGPAVASAVGHALAPDADRVAAQLEEACGVRPHVFRLGAATGSHLGPGAVAVAVLRPAA
jgi:DegV family protein with EDD domain